MRKFKPVGGSDAELAQIQMEQEQERRAQNMLRAFDVVKSYSNGEKWSQSEEDMVMMSLGLMESPPPLLPRPSRG